MPSVLIPEIDPHRNPAAVVNAENYEEGRAVHGTDFFGREARSSPFSMSRRSAQPQPRIKHLQEYVGESYFASLSELNDLVLLMDEPHRHRGSAGYKAISELKPIL